jgi:uncharacterized lipoprotein NlpE involved in copper resistance
MKKLIAILLLTLTLVGCNEKGDYQYVIEMTDGTKVKAWSVSSDGGGLTVMPPWGEGRQYFLSSNQYIRADFVGAKNK